MDKESLELIMNNPDLPIFAWVDGEICPESWGYWLGKITKAKIGEIANLDLPEGMHCYNFNYDDITYIIKNENDEEIYEILINDERFANLSDEEAEKQVKEIMDSFDYKKAIFVYVETAPDRL